MKKILISILLIILTLTLSIPANCNDDVEDPVGGTVYPVIEANSLEDFSDKLNKDIIVTYDNVIAGNATPEEMTKLANERIAKGEDYFYIPDVDCEVTSIIAFIEALRTYPEPYETSKYHVAISKDSEVAFNIHCTVKYDGMKVSIGYESMVFSAEHLHNCGYYEKISLHDLVLYYKVNFGRTEFLFRFGNEPLRISIDKELTEDEIKALPRGMFYPNIVRITDIKNGEYPSDTIDLEADDPKESDSPECV